MARVEVKTILIAEDERSLRELVRATLGGEYRYAEADDGREALDRVRQERPDLVILDLMLPGRSGLEVLAELRGHAQTRDTPVIIISAWSHAEEAAVAAGASRFFPKPFEPDELKIAVRALLDER